MCYLDKCNQNTFNLLYKVRECSNCMLTATSNIHDNHTNTKCFFICSIM